MSGGRLDDRALRIWLAQSDLGEELLPQERLQRVVREIGLPYPVNGLAALRLWGQTGDRPANWIAAADPIYLEPQLDYLYLHALKHIGADSSDLRVLIDHLQQTLGDDRRYGFTRMASYGYLSAMQPIATATVPAYMVDHQKPDDFLPQGENVDSYRRLISEIEMALHDHEINQQRLSSGKQPVNSLWLWGGGYAAEQTTRQQPPLFTDDALLTGYWYAATAVAERWPGSIAACLDKSVAGFVAAPPDNVDGPDTLRQCLEELRAALRSGRLSSLTLLFRDGLRAHVRRSHAMRVWRRSSPLLERVEPL